MNKIIVAGHICLDITPVFASKQEADISRVLIPGSLVQMDGVSVSVGGAVSNTGLGLKTLGAEVALMGRIGDDDFGRLVLAHYTKYGVGESVKISPDSSTSYSVVVAAPGNDRIFLHNPGANNDFSMEDLDFEQIKEASLFHFGYPPLMRRMYRDGGEELAEIFQRVKAMGLHTSLDMAAVDPASEAGGVDWEALLQKVLPYVDFFVPSLEELAFMLGHKLSPAFSVSRDSRVLGERLLELGAKAVMIKCGAPGIYLKTAQHPAGLPEAWSDLDCFEESYKPARIRAATGAGDTAIAAFLLAVTQGSDPKRCLRLAAATGACCVEEYDAVSGLKSFSDLEEKIAAGWEKQHTVTN